MYEQLIILHNDDGLPVGYEVWSMCDETETSMRQLRVVYPNWMSAQDIIEYIQEVQNIRYGQDS